MLFLYQKTRSGFRKTKLRAEDIIGYDNRRSVMAINLFRPFKAGLEVLYFKSFECDPPYKNFHWKFDKESFEALAELMAASIGCNAFPTGCNHLSVTLAYKLHKHV